MIQHIATSYFNVFAVLGSALLDAFLFAVQVMAIALPVSLALQWMDKTSKGRNTDHLTSRSPSR